MASAKTLVVGRPEFAVAQLFPPSVVLRTPEREVPANAVDGVSGSITSATTSAPSGPIAVQRFMPASAVVPVSAMARHTTPAATIRRVLLRMVVPLQRQSHLFPLFAALSTHTSVRAIG